ALLEHIKNSRGFDFSGYKRSSLERRMAKRLEAVQIGSYSDYQDYLEVHPDEFSELFDTLLINVTGFFRDEGAWSYLTSDVIPKPLLEKYWQVSGSKIAFRSDLRRCVIFGQNDLVQDAPISRVDLLVSRNALMYFIPETQARILSHFNFSLNPHGFLFLGNAE